MERIIYPRVTAVWVITQVLSKRRMLEDVLSEIEGSFSPQAFSWLQEVSFGTLRWKGRLDLLLDSLSDKKKSSGWLRKILLLAAYQLVVQERVHPGAVVSETVSEIKKKEGEAPARFANACLRRISEAQTLWRDGKPFAELRELSSKDQASWASLPFWLWEKCEHELGTEKAYAFAQQSLNRPELWMRTRNIKWIEEEKNSDWGTSGPVAGSVKRKGDGLEGSKKTLENLPGWSLGDIFVQDISNQILVEDVTQKVKVLFSHHPHPRALDLCAAPGGKSVGLAWNGFRVLATDRNEHRVPLLQSTIDRFPQDSIRFLPWDQLSQLPEQDLVWVDAPCSGSGVLRRHPEIRWLKDPKDVTALSCIQSELLTLGWQKVARGGFLVYSVCSILQEEGRDHLKDMPKDGELVSEWSLMPQDYPYGDGFWALLFRKK